MIHAFAILLTCQLAGEAATRGLDLPFPGPVVGMVLLVAALTAIPKLADVIRPVTSGILGHMSLLFVPAGVGVVGHFGALGGQGLALMAALLVSTVLAIAVGALTFAGVARLVGSRDE